MCENPHSHLANWRDRESRAEPARCGPAPNAIGIVAFLVERSMLLIGSARHVEREECFNVL